MTVTTISPAVRPSAAADREAIAAVLTGAFADDPVFVWTIPDAERRTATLPGVFALFADVYQPIRASQVVLASGTVAGAALWAAPGTQAVPDEDADAFASSIERVCGADAGRFFEVIGLLEEQHPTRDCYYLNLIGVDPAHRGRGLGSTLLAAALQRCDAEASPAYLEATSPDNRRLYTRHGFEVVDEITLPGGPSLWPMWREPRP
jgi:GNAT superfamily N-acetyltransferase